MTTVVITPPAPVVSLDDAKEHLIVEHGADDGLIEGYIAAAQAWISGPVGWLGRSIGVQLLEARGFFGCGRRRLDFPPVLEIDSITYEGTDGTRMTADPSTYEIDGDILIVQSGASWVTQPDHRIRYWAGYGRRDPDDAAKWINEPPAPIKVAMMMLVAQWYRIREPITIGAAVEALPFAVEALLQTYRIYR